MVTLKDTLTNHTIIGLDTSPFIYLFEQHPRYFPLVEMLFNYLNAPEVRGITSIITLIETCVQPQREGRLTLVETYKQALLNTSQVEMIFVESALAQETIRLRAQYGFRVPDALQIAATLQQQGTLFVTNDRRLSKFSECTVLVLDDYLS